MSELTRPAYRCTSQRLMPVGDAHQPDDSYRLYPGHPVADGAIELGYGAIAQRLVGVSHATIDGYVGVLWDVLRARLEEELGSLGLEPLWFDAREWMLPSNQIESLVEPFLGGDDPLFGRRFAGRLEDFFQGFPAQPEVEEGQVAIAYGCGAALAAWGGPLLYADLPKNELQFRSRAGVVANLGAAEPIAPKPQYKRFYFVDWVALNQHKEQLLPRVDWVIDAQDAEQPTLASAGVLRAALEEMSRTVFRVRPWFEPGPWGGQWLRELVPELPSEAPNYAWSFELIVPENGLVLTDGGRRLEVSFDWLMFAHHEQVLGESAWRFGYEFPIRFDYLDTMDGGNLSVQCHPRTEYIRKHFGETFTQDECYYLMECRPDARVYLGFQEDLDQDQLRADLEHGLATGEQVDIEQHVRSHPAEKHGLYLIPNGTVHCSGADCVVLEISATPYIFTFKMYDWQRLDLEGNPRPLNIARAFENLDFTRRGDVVEQQLISKPSEIGAGEGWRVVHLPTHAEHFYDVHRLEFDHELEVVTEGSPHVLMLVEGRAVACDAGSGKVEFRYGETFVVPAAAGGYRLRNLGGGRALVVKAFMKPAADS